MAPQTPENMAPETLPEPDADNAFHGTAKIYDMHNHEEGKFDISFKRLYNDLKTIDWSKVVWIKVFLILIVLHLSMSYGAWLLFSGQTMFKTMIWTYIVFIANGIGVTIGVHRLWAHRSYKAKTPTRIIFMLCNTLSFQGSVYYWVRDHRVHHKYSETDADPYDARRGLFFSHMGWFMYRKHPLVKEKGNGIDLSDITSDPILMFQYKYYYPLVALVCFGIPTAIPWYFWNENVVTALMVAGFLRYGLTVHATWCLNSIGHWYGSKPFDKNIFPVNTRLVNILAMGEGWHNFHHVFPYDYRGQELGGWLSCIFSFNVCTLILDGLALIGQVYDRRTVSDEMWKRRVLRTGDGSHKTAKVA